MFLELPTLPVQPYFLIYMIILPWNPSLLIEIIHKIVSDYLRAVQSISWVSSFQVFHGTILYIVSFRNYSPVFRVFSIKRFMRRIRLFLSVQLKSYVIHNMLSLLYRYFRVLNLYEYKISEIVMPLS